MDIDPKDRHLAVRLSLAQAALRLWEHAYDALLHHGVNFRTLPEYHDTTYLDAARKGSVTEGQSNILRWIERLTSGIHAAVRRKAFKVTD